MASLHDCFQLWSSQICMCPICTSDSRVDMMSTNPWMIIEIKLDLKLTWWDWNCVELNLIYSALVAFPVVLIRQTMLWANGTTFVVSFSLNTLTSCARFSSGTNYSSTKSSNYHRTICAGAVAAYRSWQCCSLQELLQELLQEQKLVVFVPLMYDELLRYHASSGWAMSNDGPPNVGQLFLVSSLASSLVLRASSEKI